jgi:hypothetical protein
MKLKAGDKVHYIPFEGCDPSVYENGIVKSGNEYDLTTVFVVYKCNEDWSNYANYTGASTKIEDLREGWYENEERKTD